MSNSKKIRGGFFIYPKFQFSLIALQLGVLIAIMAPVAITLFRTFSNLEKAAHEASLPPTHSIYKFLTLEKGLIFNSVVWPLLIGAVTIILLTVWLSDRLAGPIVRLRTEFELMKNKGELHEVKFRKGDFFSDLPQVINEALKPHS